jgi:hypothetical protein
MLDPHWVTGFTDGEGCFVLGVYLRNSGKRARHYNTVTPAFSVTQRADGAGVLVELEEFFGVGTAEPRSASPTAGSPMLHFVVRRREELPAIIKHFDAYPLQTRKQQDFLVWREGVLIVLDAHARGPSPSGTPRGRRIFTDQEWRRLHKLHRNLQAGRRFKQP